MLLDILALPLSKGELSSLLGDDESLGIGIGLIIVDPRMLPWESYLYSFFLTSAPSEVTLYS